MYCPKCGAENAEGVQFCQSCSVPLDRSGSPGANEPAKTSGLAIAALILGILSFFTCYITLIPAVIVGAISLFKIGNSKGRLKGLGLAITGIALPVILIPVFAIVMAIFMPALGSVKVQAQKLVCGTNMKGMANAIQVYQFDFNDEYPTGSKWCDLLMTHADVGPKSFVCQSGQQGRSHYALNENALKLGQHAPPNMVLMFECQPGWNQVGGPELITTENHQGEGCNVMHVDGSVIFVRTENLDTLQWTADDNAVEVKY